MSGLLNQMFGRALYAGMGLAGFFVALLTAQAHPLDNVDYAGSP